MENQDLKESVLLNLRSVTQSCKGGVPFERLQRDYRDLLGSPIPFRDLGYKSLEGFIKDIPHVISLRRNEEGQLVAEGVADATTAHIVSLVSRQKGENKKRGFRKPPPHIGMRRSLSSRYTFREGPRSAHSHYKTSPPHYPPKHFPTKSRSPPVARVNDQAKPWSSSPARINDQTKAWSPSPARVNDQTKPWSPPTARVNSQPKPPAPSKAPAPAQHSKSRPSNNQVPRSYEIAPRFLKLQNQSRNISPPPDELIYSPTHIAPSFPTNTPDESYMIPPPRPSMRTLPSRPQHTENAHISQINSLESARSAKEFVEMYARMENLSAEYNTLQMGQKAKNKGFVSTLKLGDKKYQTYPDYKPTREEAEELAASKAKDAIKKQVKEQMAAYPETPYGSAEEIKKLLARIEEIVCEKPSGMYENGIVREYEDKFNEKLPSCWPELLKESCSVEIDEVNLKNVKVPKGINFIVRPIKESSSGAQTPSSTSSKTEFAYEGLDSSTLKKNLVEISLPKVPENKLVPGNVWDVFVTNVSGWFSVRLLDYNDKFLALSEEMAQFYKMRSFPVMEVYENQLYAACVDDNSEVWHRVLVEEIKEDGQISCYFVDEGDFTYVIKENLQEMSPNFMKLPYQAIHISLDGLEAYENCIKFELLEKSILGRTLIAEVKRCNQIPEFFPDMPGIHRTIYSVTLYDTSDSSGEDVNLNEWLKQSVKESLVCKLPKLLSSSCAYLSHVTQEGLVYLRFTNPAHCWIEQELDKLAPVFEEASSVMSKIPLHTMCVAKYESGTWHRATISENSSVIDDPDVIEVFFVDYGHVGFVGKFEICELEPISELLASIPPQAVCCELQNALPSPTAQWTEAATMKLLELAPFDQELIVRVMREADQNNLPKVNLYKRNRDANIISINDSLAFVEELSQPSPKVPSKLSLQPRKTSLKTNLSGAIPDVAVSAEEQMSKRLMANSLSADELKWLNTPDDIKTPGAFEVLPPMSLSLPEIPEVNKTFDVFVTMAAHPCNFIVQPYGSCIELDTLMKDMISFYSCEENQFEMDVSVLRKNEYYAALHSDGSWYRVRIENIIPDPVMVAAHYVDFGDFNSVSISCLQPLYKNFRKLPCQAIQASLSGVRPYESDWDPVHCVQFREMVTEKSFVSVIKKKQVEIKDDIPTLVVELILIDTQDSQKDVYIHEELIEKMIARPL